MLFYKKQLVAESFSGLHLAFGQYRASLSVVVAVTVQDHCTSE